MDDAAIAKYARNIVSNRNSATRVQRHILEIEGWQPQIKQCHQNVIELEALNLGYKPVHGWLIMDFIVLGYFELLAHSIVKNEAGEMLDITPVLQNPMGGNPSIYPFFEHIGTTDDYAEMIDVRKIVRIRIHLNGRIQLGG